MTSKQFTLKIYNLLVIIDLLKQNHEWNQYLLISCWCCSWALVQHPPTTTLGVLQQSSSWEVIYFNLNMYFAWHYYNNYLTFWPIKKRKLIILLSVLFYAFLMVVTLTMAILAFCIRRQPTYEAEKYVVKGIKNSYPASNKFFQSSFDSHRNSCACR